jgi:hypothetical protein
MVLTGNPETSVASRLTPRNNPEDGRIQILRNPKISLAFQFNKAATISTCGFVGDGG